MIHKLESIKYDHNITYNIKSMIKDIQQSKLMAKQFKMTNEIDVQLTIMTASRWPKQKAFSFVLPK